MSYQMEHYISVCKQIHICIDGWLYWYIRLILYNYW